MATDSLRFWPPESVDAIASSLLSPLLVRVAICNTRWISFNSSSRLIRPRDPIAVNFKDEKTIIFSLTVRLGKK